MGKRSLQNLIGPAIRKVRRQRGLTQAMLAARCNRVGWDIGENTISKIEAQIRCVTDEEIVFLTKALNASVQDFFSER
jgi:transcriptional regulator with XRE-family HTH domain